VLRYLLSTCHISTIPVIFQEDLIEKLEAEETESGEEEEIVDVEIDADEEDSKHKALNEGKVEEQERQEQGHVTVPT
jgi:hypothetical protein